MSPRLGVSDTKKFLLARGVGFDPSRVRGIDVLKREGVNCGQFVGVQFSDCVLDCLVAFASSLEQDAKLLLVLYGTVPRVEALDFGDLYASCQLALY